MNCEKLAEFLSVRMELWQSYHNHKESMANAGFLVQLSLFGSIITEGLWPPAWVSKITSLSDFGTFSVYFLLWFLIHYYTRWQLINKRIGALYFSGFEQSFLYFSTHELTEKDAEINEEESHKTNKLKNFFGKIIYIPGGYSRMDASVKNFPNFVAKAIKTQFKSGSGAEVLEILMTYLSIILLLIVGIKIFFS